MIQTLKTVGISMAIIALAACDLFDFDKKNEMMREGSSQGQASDMAGYQTNGSSASGVYSTTSQTSQMLAASESSKISGSSVVLQPGSLSIDTAVHIDEGASLSASDSLSQVGLDNDSVADSGAPVMIMTEETVDASSPMSLAIPMPASTGLALAADKYEMLVVIYHVYKAAEKRFEFGVIPRKAIVVSDGKAKFSSLYFGTYQTAYVTITIEEPKAAEVEEGIKDGDGNAILEKTADGEIKKSVDNLGVDGVADTLPPEVQLTINAGEYVNSKELTYVLTASEELKPFELSAFNVKNGKVLSIVSLGDSQFNINVNAIADGLVGLEILPSALADLAGNKVVDLVVAPAVIVDTVAPSAVIQHNIDPINNLLEIEFALDDDTDTNSFQYAIVASNSCANAKYIAPKPAGLIIKKGVDAYPDGNMSLCVLALDLAGNIQGKPTVVSWVKDTSVPGLTVTSPANNSFCNQTSCASMVFNGSCSEAGAVVSMSGSANATATCDGSAWSISKDVSSLSEGTLTFNFTIADALGNTSSAMSLNVVKDATPPSVVKVYSNKADGSYAINENISIFIEFTETLNITGAPALLLETGAFDRTATYVDLSGTTVELLYTTATNDVNTDLEYNSVNALTVSAGNILDGAGNIAVLTLPVPGDINSLSGQNNILVNSSIPALTVDNTNGEYCNASNCNTFGVSGSCSSDGTSNVTVGGAISDISFNCSGGSWAGEVNLSGLGDGSHNLTIDHNDGVNDAVQVVLSVDVDQTAPVVGDIADQTTNTGISITASATDMNTMTFTWSKEAGTGTVTFSPADTLNTTISADTDGLYTIRLTATDAAGNTASDEFTLNWDTMGPTVNIVGITSGSYCNSTNCNSVTVNGTCSEDGTVALGGSVNANGVTGICSANVWTATINYSTEVDGLKNITADMVDAAGNPADQASFSFTKDTLVPMIVSIDSDAPNNSYLVNADTIEVKVTFSKNIFVTGVPFVQLNTHGVNNNVAYTSGSGTPQLVFNYTVQSDHWADPLNVNFVMLDGGLIKDAAGNAADLSLPVSNLNVKNIKVDTSLPWVTEASFTNGADLTPNSFPGEWTRFSGTYGDTAPGAVADVRVKIYFTKNSINYSYNPGSQEFEENMTYYPVNFTGGNWTYDVKDNAFDRDETYYFSMEVEDTAGNLSTIPSKSFIWDPPLVTVIPINPGAPDFLDVVKIDNPAVICTNANVNNYNECEQDGAAKKIDITSISSGSCAGITAEDKLGAFEWFCDGSNAPSEVFMMGHFGPNGGMEKLLNPSSWKPNSVKILSGGTVVAQSVETTWWSDPVVPIPTNLTAVVSLNSPGTIYTISGGDVFSVGHEITASDVAVVSLGGKLVAHGDIDTFGTNCNLDTYNSNNATPCLLWTGVSSATEGVLISAVLDGNGLLVHPLHFGSQASLMAVRGTHIFDGETGLTIYDAQKGLFEGLTATMNYSGGIRIVNSAVLANNHIFMDARIIGSYDNGIYLENSSGNLFKNVITSNHDFNGLELYDSPDNVFLQLLTVHNNNNGIFEHGITTSQGGRNAYGFVTAANNASSGVVLYSDEGGSQVFASLISNNGADEYDSGLEVSEGLGVTEIMDIAIADHPSAVKLIFLNSSTDFYGNLHLPGLTSGGDCISGPDTPFTTNMTLDNGSGNLTTECGVTGGETIDTAYDFSGIFNNVSSFASVSTGTLSWELVSDKFSTWGKGAFNDVGSCFGDAVCSEWSWKVIGPNITHSENFPNTAATPCPAVAGGDRTLTRNSTSFIVRAMEDLHDHKNPSNNGNGLCEANESCIYAGNLGFYQGDGPITNHTCTFTNGTVSGVKLRAYDSAVVVP